MPRALGLGEGGDEARFLGRVEAGLDLLAERELAVVGLAAVGRAGALGEADPGVGGELGQLVGAALRLEQVGGEHRVVVEVAARRPRGRRRRAGRGGRRRAT